MKQLFFIKTSKNRYVLKGDSSVVFHSMRDIFAYIEGKGIDELHVVNME